MMQYVGYSHICDALVVTRRTVERLRQMTMLELSKAP